MQKLNLNIQELKYLYKLDKRTINICMHYSLVDVCSIVKYYEKNNDFLKLRYCGEISNKILIKICKDYYRRRKKKKEQKQITIRPHVLLRYQSEHNISEELLASLNEMQISLINNLINIKLRTLTTKCYNAIKFYSQSNLNLEALMDFIIDDDFNYKNLRNIGKDSAEELLLFFNSIKDTIIVVKNSYTSNETVSYNLETFLMLQYNLNYDVIKKSLFNENNSVLPIFKTISLLIDNCILKSEKQRIVFKYGLNIYQSSEPLSNVDLIKRTNYSNERIRQLKHKSINELPQIFSSFSFFRNILPEFYPLVLDNAGGINITGDFVNQINNSEKTDFNIAFISVLIGTILLQDYKIDSSMFELLLKNSTLPNMIRVS